ncbi:mRNA-degrading endonuclease toxin of MazEF toxin-antitoxin module [Streptomyces sp. BK022]|uniref:type II toxin-antitoxin system PemK/MazF family toxin n=1 Tax=Streptomyces sp. BK022 TaxID=2512123 RepID=UPI0010289E95|nr:type II toxin-antitoxin system PemK/MazF family toxin [Streptomyces sp. BK022]RZU28203.1 mRNA-degrading endonuclease toxin of MazEF toxin-antitoxin module [Streptomyces sp. BK022]
MTEIQRGSVWRVPTVGRDRTVLVVQHNAVIKHHPGGVACLIIQEVEDARDTLLTVVIEEPVRGAVMASDGHQFRPLRFEQGKCLGYLSAEDMERVNTALRAALDL